MTLSIRRYPPRAFVGEIIQAPAEAPVDPAYRNIAAANDHLHRVINALLKERSGQPLTSQEQSLIDTCAASKGWQLQHTNKEV